MDPKQKEACGDRPFDRDDTRFRSASHKIRDDFVSRPTETHEIVIIFHHGGFFVGDPVPNYIREHVYETKEGWNIDEISVLELGKIVNSIGYRTYKGLWYRHPERDLSNGLRPLNNDQDIIRFIHDLKGHTKVDVYVEHLIDNHVYCEKPNSNESEVEVVEISVGVVHTSGVPKDGDGSGGAEDKSESDDPEYVDWGSNEGESDEDYDEEKDLDSGDDISLDDSDYDEGWDWANVLPEETVNPLGVVGEEGNNGSIGATITPRNPAPTTFEDFEDEDGDSEDLESPPSSEEDDGGKKKFPKFKLSEDAELVKFEVGQIFTSADLVRTAVKEYAMQARKNVYFAKNDKTRIVVKCMKGCSFYLRASKTSVHTYWQIVTLKATHTCHRTSKNRQAKTRWLAKKFMSTLRHTPNMKVRALVEEAKNRWGVVLTRYQCYRAQKRALEMIQGAVTEQYKHLRSYAHELVRSNPNSSVVIKTSVGVNGPIFQRMYVCFNACKHAFVTTCRPLIGLDGCFLKGVYGGQLLSAVGKDGNNQMFPIAFAIVEAETKDSWSWFLNLLMEDLNKIEQKKWAFISDQQKGLVPTLQNMDEDVEHRLCVKHLYGNWRKRYPGALMKEAFWAAARANTMPEFSRAMSQIKNLNENAWKDMCEIPPSVWSRAAYNTYTCCDLQVNNMCEAFNRAILEYRDKPIISLVDGLKFYITNRIVKQKELMLRYGGNICPMIQQKLESSKRAADGWSPLWHGDVAYSLFEVSNSVDKYVVNLKDHTCSCRKWNLSGIPCCHAIACMWFNNQIPEDFVNPYYRKSMFLSTYDHIVLPCNGPKIWPIVHVEPINPPYIRRAPGRPKKQRRKTNDEPKAPGKLGRQQPTIRCRRCGQLGHNKRTCIGKTAADRTIPKGGNKTHTQVLQPDEGSSQQGSQSEVLQARQSEVSGTQPEVQGTSGQQSGSKRKNMEQMGTQQSHN